MDGVVLLCIMITVLFGMLAWVFAGYIRKEERLSEMAKVAKKKEKQANVAANYNEDDTLRDLGAGRF